MATAISPRSSAQNNEIKLETNIPQTLALKYTTGKPVGQWGNIMFTLVDERRMFLNTEDASEFEHALVDLQYRPADFIRVTRVKHGNSRGGGFSIRVERVDDTDEPGEAAARVQRSVATAARPSAPPPSAPSPSRTEALLEKSVEMARNGVLPVGSPVITLASAKVLSAYMTAVDTLLEAQSYAQRKGLMLSITCEDVRCLAATIFIDQKGGTR